VLFDDFVRLIAASRSMRFSFADQEQWIADRLAEFEMEFNDHEATMFDRRTYFIRKITLDDGSMIAFHFDITQRKQAEQEIVKAKVNGSRTKIYYAKKSNKVAKAMKAGKTIKRSKLKTGYICKITYVAGGKNEPSELQCYFAKP